MFSPEAIANQHALGRIAAKVFVFGGEIVSECGRNAEHLQEAGRYEGTLDFDRQWLRPAAGLFGVISAGRIGGVFRVVTGDGLKSAVQAVPIFEPDRRDKAFRVLLLRAIFVKDDEATRVRIRERAQKNGINGRKDRRVRADAQRQGCDDGERERWHGAQSPQGISNVGQNRIENRDAVDITQLFFNAHGAAEIEDRFAAGPIGREPLRDLFLYQFFEVKLKLVIELASSRFAKRPTP